MSELRRPKNDGSQQHRAVRELRDAFGLFTTGVTVVTAVRQNGEPVGITANSFTSVSLNPPLLLWCLASSSNSVDAFAEGRAFAVHIMAHEQSHLALHFARRSQSKFEVDRHWQSNPTPPRLAEALCRFDCRVRARHAGGDHTIIVGEVQALTRHSGVPLAFHGGRFGSFVGDARSPQVDVWHQWHGEWV
jgi:flavin reductase (DIM6/NTAB) family NADH-FMN oxidoreductase RutF